MKLPVRQTAGAAANAIEVDALSWRYPGAARPALDDVSFAIRPGTCFGLIGPNGAGKSTLFSLLSGMRRPRQGDILVHGASARKQPSQVRRLCALAPQDFAFYPQLTIFENLSFFAGAYGLKQADWKRRYGEVVEICRLEEMIGKRAEACSGGQKRRLNLAIALLNEPRVLYLDEPTVGIDARSRTLIVEAVGRLRETGATVVYTSHYMEEIEALCDVIGVVNAGRLAAFGPIGQFRREGDTPRVTMRLPSAPHESVRELLTAEGARWIDNRQFEAPARSPRDVCAIVDRLGRLDLSPVQIRYGESRLEKVYADLIARDDAAQGRVA